MSTIKNANGWTDTNSIEAHLRREGRIVGKMYPGIQNMFRGRMVFGWTSPCRGCARSRCPRLRVIGHRRDKSAAEQLVERALA